MGCERRARQRARRPGFVFVAPVRRLLVLAGDGPPLGHEQHALLRFAPGQDRLAGLMGAVLEPGFEPLGRAPRRASACPARCMVWSTESPNSSRLASSDPACSRSHSAMTRSSHRSSAWSRFSTRIERHSRGREGRPRCRADRTSSVVALSTTCVPLAWAVRTARYRMFVAELSNPDTSAKSSSTHKGGGSDLRTPVQTTADRGGVAEDDVAAQPADPHPLALVPEDGTMGGGACPPAATFAQA